jgi:uncharacterized protein
MNTTDRNKPSDDRCIQEAIRRLVAEFAPLSILVFGSVARENAGDRSDLDLLVVLPSVRHRRDVTVAMRVALAGLGVPIDVIVTSPDEVKYRGWIKGTLLHAALREGVEVYRKEEAHA